MNEFVIVDGLPYLYAGGKVYAVRWDDEGFTVGQEVKMDSIPAVTHCELSIFAKCAGRLDSIGAGQETEKVPDDDPAPKKKSSGRKKSAE
jgi:hypothetical protein